MSSWWSALNPFVEVKAEEATEDKKEEEPKDEGDDKGIHPILHSHSSSC
jgi:hypothetical protein